MVGGGRRGRHLLRDPALDFGGALFIIEGVLPVDLPCLSLGEGKVEAGQEDVDVL